MTTNQTFGYTPTPQTQTHACAGNFTHTARALHTWAHENACVVTLVHPHTHAQASTSSAQNNQTLKKKKTSLSWFDAVGELGFNSRSQLIFFDNSKISDCIQQLYIYTYACMSLYMYTYTHLCMCIYAHIRVCIYRYADTYICTYTVCIYTHMYLKPLMSGLPLLYRVSTTVLLPYKTRENSIRSWIHVHHKRPLLFNVK